MSVSDPRKGWSDRNTDNNVCDYARDQDRVMVVAVVYEYDSHSKYQPKKTRSSTTRVYAPQMLEHGSASESEPQRRPLGVKREAVGMMRNALNGTLANNVFTVR